MNQVVRTKAAGRQVVVLLAAIFALPLLVAFWLYYGTGWRPAGHTNHGELIAPRSLLGMSTSGTPATAFSGKWSLVVIGDNCEAECQHTLWYARQTWLSMGKSAERIQRVWLTRAASSPALPPDEPGLIRIETGDDLTWLPAFSAEHPQRTIFIVDPRGNLMMRYDSNQDPKGLRQDLQRLLDLSHIG
ncbi:MAG TPA: hypothetical protein VF848_03110 [Steroidobacteraceae bacterium]